MNAISNLPFLAKLLLPVLVIATLWYLSSQTDTLTPRPAGVNRSGDYTLQDFTMTIMNQHGYPARKITGSKMIHFPDDDSTEVTDPVAYFFTADGKTWIVTADQGHTRGKGDHILLTGHVVITQANRSDLELTTEKLTIDTRLNTAYTDRPVTIISPNGITHSIGLHAALGDKTINLHSKVKGHYDAPPVH